MQVSRRRSMNGGGSSSSRVRVAVRIRPPEYRNARDETRPPCVSPGPQAPNIVEYHHDGQTKTYTYDHVFASTSTQEDVYSASLQPLMGQFLDGYNVTVMAYGQTGSGKTYTMGNKAIVPNTTPTTSPCRERGMSSSSLPAPTINVAPGYRGAPEDGLIPRFLSDLFANLKKEPSVRTIHVTFVEIYCDSIRDLLNGGAERNLTIREDPHNVWVENVHSLQVDGLPKALELLNLGRSRQAMGSTALNDESSRSHAVYTMEVSRKFQSETKRSKLTFVDLAGSERIKKTQVEGVRKRESIQINVGLSALGNVINALADDKMIQRRSSGDSSNGRPNSPDGYVPYRASKLTRLLRDALGGNSRTLFLACVSPLDSNFDETLSTLQYANRARNIQNKAEKHIDHDPVPVTPAPSPSELEVARLTEEVARLQQQINELTERAKQREDELLAAQIARQEKKQRKREARRDAEVTTEFIITPQLDAETQVQVVSSTDAATMVDPDELAPVVCTVHSNAETQCGTSLADLCSVDVNTVSIQVNDQATETQQTSCEDADVMTDEVPEVKVTTFDVSTECIPEPVQVSEQSTETVIDTTNESTETNEPASQDAEMMTEIEETTVVHMVDASTGCASENVSTMDQTTEISVDLTDRSTETMPTETSEAQVMTEVERSPTMHTIATSTECLASTRSPADPIPASTSKDESTMAESSPEIAIDVDANPKAVKSLPTTPDSNEDSSANASSPEHLEQIEHKCQQNHLDSDEHTKAKAAEVVRTASVHVSEELTELPHKTKPREVDDYRPTSYTVENANQSAVTHRKLDSTRCPSLFGKDEVDPAACVDDSLQGLKPLVSRPQRPHLTMDVPVFVSRLSESVPVFVNPSTTSKTAGAPEVVCKKDSILQLSENQIEAGASVSCPFIPVSFADDSDDDFGEMSSGPTRGVDDAMAPIEFVSPDSTESESESFDDLCEVPNVPADLEQMPMPIDVTVKVTDTSSTGMFPPKSPVPLLCVDTSTPKADFVVDRSPRGRVAPVVSPREQKTALSPPVRPLRLFSFEDCEPPSEKIATKATYLYSGLRELVRDEFGEVEVDKDAEVTIAVDESAPSSSSAVDKLLTETGTFLTRRRQRQVRIAKRRREVATLEVILQIENRAPISETDLAAYSEATQDQFLTSLIEQLIDLAAQRLHRRLRNRLQADELMPAEIGDQTSPFLSVTQCQACADWFFKQPQDATYFTKHILPLITSGWISVAESDLEAEHEWLQL